MKTHGEGHPPKLRMSLTTTIKKSQKSTDLASLFRACSSFNQQCSDWIDYPDSFRQVRHLLNNPNLLKTPYLWPILEHFEHSILNDRFENPRGRVSHIKASFEQQ